MGKIDGGLRGTCNANLLGVFFQPIESWSTGSGTPDSHYLVKGVSGWIEHKQTDANMIGSLKPEQVGWGERYWRNGGHHFFFVRQHWKDSARKEETDILWVISGKHGRLLKDKGLFGVEESGEHLLKCVGGAARWNWDIVRKILLGQYDR